MQEQIRAEDEGAVELLSRDRLDGYHVKTGQNTDRDLLGRYLFNVAVSHALYPYFHALEVILRNRIYAAVAKDHPIDPDRLDLYNDFPCWLDATSSVLIPDHRREVAKAKGDVRKDLRRRLGDRMSQASRFRTPGRLVAKLPFSFWVFLFDTEYLGHGRGDQGLLWPRYTAAVFPGSANVRMSDVQKRVRRLLVVRNRIMHYERIAPWDDWTNGHAALRADHVRDDILELLDWMALRASKTLRDHGPLDEFFELSFGRYLRRYACNPDSGSSDEE